MISIHCTKIGPYCTAIFLVEPKTIHIENLFLNVRQAAAKKIQTAKRMQKVAMQQNFQFIISSNRER
jgi:hypothetical protein